MPGEVEKIQMIFITLVWMSRVWISRAVAEEEIPLERLQRMFPRQYGPEDMAMLKTPAGWQCQLMRFYAVYTIWGTRCVDIPKNTSDMEPTSEISIYATAIASLPKQAFLTWENLRNLDIRANKHLRTIAPGAFYGLVHLTNLTLAENDNLEYIQSDTFEGLTSLRILRLLKNSVFHIADITPALRPSILPLLQILDLSDNEIQYVSRDDFRSMHGSSLEQLIMENTQTTDLDGNAFAELTNVSSLHLGNNPLTGEQLTSLVTKLRPSVVYLSISSTRVFDSTKEFFAAISTSKIKKLDISSNVIGNLNTDILPHCPLLESLDLSNTGLPAVNPEAFQRLPKLTSLSLGNNRLSAVPFFNLPGVRSLDLSGNSDFLPLGTKFVVPDEVFLNMTGLEILDLSDNFIEILNARMFAHTSQLRYLYLRNAKVHMFDGGTFKTNKNLLYLDISQNDFPAIRGLSSDLFLGLESLQALDMYSCTLDNIDSDTFVHLRRLRYLSLRENSFLRLEKAVVTPSLEIIDLRRNYISSWETRIFERSHNLKAILLGNNHLTTLTTAMVADIGGTLEIDLAQNPLECTCSLYDAISPLLERSTVMRRILSRYENSCEGDQTLTEFWLRTIKSRECKTLTVAERASIGVGVIAAIALIVAIAFRWRWDLLYFWLEVKQFFAPERRPLITTGGGWQYDAFISFSHRDKRFVSRLVAVLEGRFGARVCVYDRDFAAGALISEAVLAAVAVSRTTVLVLSEAFVKSQWCLWEAAISQQRQLFFRRALPDSLVIVRLGPLDDSLLTNTLRLLLTARIHLEWHPNPKRQRVFWHRLWEAISRASDPPSRSSHNNDNHNENVINSNLILTNIGQPPKESKHTEG